MRVKASVAAWRMGLILLLVCQWLGWGTQGAEDTLIGRAAAEWTFTDWQGSKAHQLAELKGKVVLVRWWTAPGCPFCSASAPALNEFHAAYKDKGLAVVGAYHHKSRTPLRVEKVKGFAKEFGFQFPVAIDREWKTLHRWWLDTGDRDFTSVSFLIDRQGVIRFIHPGGQYVKGDDDYAALKGKIEELLAEK
jgi:peroxiredoxin